MYLKKYFTYLLEQRDMLDRKVNLGRMSEEKAYHLTDKLNEWYEEAKRLDKNLKRKSKTTK
jgi:t-SNARE complex subunit (syntaxin)